MVCSSVLRSHLKTKLHPGGLPRHEIDEIYRLSARINLHKNFTKYYIVTKATLTDFFADMA